MDSATTAAVRRSCFTDEDDGLASIAGTEAGFSGNTNLHHHHHFGPIISRPICYGNSLNRRGSYRNLSNSSRFNRFYDEDQIHPHFLDACFLCKKSLRGNMDIFMYRGDVPFCSDDCRQEQIDLDEAKEKKNWNLSSSSMKSLRKGQRKSTSPNKDQGDYPFRTGAVAA